MGAGVKGREAARGGGREQRARARGWEGGELGDRRPEGRGPGDRGSEGHGSGYKSFY